VDLNTSVPGGTGLRRHKIAVLPAFFTVFVILAGGAIDLLLHGCGVLGGPLRLRKSTDGLNFFVGDESALRREPAATSRRGEKHVTRR